MKKMIYFIVQGMDNNPSYKVPISSGKFPSYTDKSFNNHPFLDSGKFPSYTDESFNNHPFLDESFDNNNEIVIINNEIGRENFLLNLTYCLEFLKCLKNCANCFKGCTFCSMKILLMIIDFFKNKPDEFYGDNPTEKRAKCVTCLKYLKNCLSCSHFFLSCNEKIIDNLKKFYKNLLPNN